MLPSDVRMLLREKVVGVESDKNHEQHDDAEIQRTDGPFVLVISLVESPNTEHVRHDGDRSDDEADCRTDTRSDAQNWEDEGEDNISQRATDTGNQNRLAEQALGLISGAG